MLGPATFTLHLNLAATKLRLSREVDAIKHCQVRGRTSKRACTSCDDASRTKCVCVCVGSHSSHRELTRSRSLAPSGRRTRSR